MRSGFALICALLVAGVVHGQETLYQTPGAGAGFQLATIGEDGFAGPIFAPPPGTPSGPPEITGTADGLAINFGSGVAIGFDFIRPFWSFRDFTLTVPAGFGNKFPLLGDVGHTDDHFAAAPTLDIRYRFPESDLGVSASGRYLSLSGNLNRDLTFPGGVGSLTASSSLTIATANFIELTRQFAFVDLYAKQSDCLPGLQDLLVDLSIGARYSSIDQNYSGSLTNSLNGVNVSTRSSSQSFQGFGVTGATQFLLPEGDEWLLFSRLRASVLIGENNKHSTLSIDVANQPGLPSVLDDDTETLIPILELESGVAWGNQLGVPPAQRKGLSYHVRASLLAEYWGDVGPLSAGSSQGFRSSDLFLVGASLMVGVER
jgi:hypothetical protein